MKKALCLMLVALILLPALPAALAEAAQTAAPEADQAALPDEGVADAPQDAAAQVGVGSRWLMLRTRVTMGDGVLTANALIDAHGGAPVAGMAPPAIVRRDWGDSD